MKERHEIQSLNQYRVLQKPIDQSEFSLVKSKPWLAMLAEWYNVLIQVHEFKLKRVDIKEPQILLPVFNESIF